METFIKKTATHLTSESVSILTQEFQTITVTEIQFVDGVETEVDVEREVQIGSNHRRAYTNTEVGRVSLVENEPEDIVAEVFTVWGDTPTVEEPVFDENYVPEPTLVERVAIVEEKLANGGSSGDVWDELAAAITEGVNEV